MTWLRLGVPRTLRVASIKTALGIAALAHLPVSAAQDVQTQEVGANGDVLLAGQVELQHLLELAARRLGLSIQYDRAALQGATTTLRIGAGISDEQLWALTNQLLASHGLTTIHAAGAVAVAPAKPAVFQIVKLPDAAALARVDSELPAFPAPGFTTLRVRIQNRPLNEIADAAKLLISKPAGAIQELQGDGSIIVSDLRPRLEQVVELIRAMDDPSSACTIDRVEARYIPATSLAALATAAATTSGTLSIAGLQGKLTATMDDRALILIAPASEQPRWRALLDQFDQPSGVETRTYSSAAFTLNDVAQLLEQTARDPGPRGSGDRWRIVNDALGGLLVVTATPSEHEQIAAVMTRLEAQPAEVRRPVRAFPIRNRSVEDIVVTATPSEHEQIAAVMTRLEAQPAEVRRPVRAFPIRNRSVEDIIEVLTAMQEAGVLDATITQTMGGGGASGPSSIAQNDLQRSIRAADESPIDPARPPGSNSATTTAPAERSADRQRSRSPNGGGPATSSSANGLTLTADEGTNTLIAVGEPRQLAQLEELLRTLDVRQPQVMIEVLVVSLNEADTLDLGVELEKIEVSGDTVITLASLFGLAPAGAVAPTGKGFSGLILNPGDFRVLIRALQTLNNGRALNMPKVLVNNNHQANLDAVVQQPFVSTNASDTVATTSFGGFENAGTTITVKPQIAKGDHLILEYAVSLSAFVGESSDAGIPPPRQQNNLQSVVTIPDGYTVVVGGIEITTKANAVSQVPLLGSIPILGEAFKSRSISDSRSRFYVFIRPTILRHEGFEDLKYLSNVASSEAQVDDGFPEVQPRIIK